MWLCAKTRCKVYSSSAADLNWKTTPTILANEVTCLQYLKMDNEAMDTSADSDHKPFLR